MKAKPQQRKELLENSAKVWVIQDNAKLQEALSLIHQAVEKPHFSSYRIALLKQRIPLFPPRRDWESQIWRIMYVESGANLAMLQLLKLGRVISAGAQESATRGDAAGFHQLVGDWRQLCRKITLDSDSVLDQLVSRAFIAAPLKNFRDAAQALGLAEEAKRFAQLDARLITEKEARKQSENIKRRSDLARKKGSFLASLSVPTMMSQLQDPPALGDADLRPGRYADHAALSSAVATFAWILLGLCTGLAALCRFRRRSPMRQISLRMLDLLRLSDWLWILLVGVGAPMLWYSFIVYMTPLSGREWSIMATQLIQPAGQLLAMLVLIIVLPSVIGSWRLERRAEVFGLRARHPWLGWLAAISAALAIPALGAVMWIPNLASMGPAITIAAILIGIPWLWILTGLCRYLFRRSSESLRRPVLAQMMVPAGIFAAFMLAAWASVQYALERHWIQQDRIFEITTEAPAFSRYEYEVAQVLRAENLQSLDHDH